MDTAIARRSVHRETAVARRAGGTPPEPLIAITSGEPAGIGPDICVSLAREPLAGRVVFLGDPDVLAARARALEVTIGTVVRQSPDEVTAHCAGELQMLPNAVAVPVRPGNLNRRNAGYVLEMLGRGADLCLDGQCAALVTAPVHKSVIAESGVAFSGHTEFLAARCRVAQPVMLLVGPRMRVALATTHLALRDVPARITAAGLTATLEVLERDLRRRFGFDRPRIAVLGLNPHAGESGLLGNEEIDIIAPTVDVFRRRGMSITGPIPADTAFTREALTHVDAVLAMYHDQGLPVIKAQGFGEVVNVTLGLPIVRTSVDHGTALSLAGTGQARHESLRAAVELARVLTQSGSER